MQWALHAANVFILCSFLVRDLIILRLLSITAGVLFCLYFHHNNMMEPIVWNVLFSIVNLFQIGSHFYQSRKIPLNSMEQFLHDRFFPTLRPVEIRDLYQEAQSNQIDSEQNIEIEGLGLVISGTLALEKKRLITGNFVGTRSFLSQQQQLITGTSQESLSYLHWNTHNLRKWTAQSTERHNLLLKALSKDLLNQIDQR